jgi:hypothetical protein
MDLVCQDMKKVEKKKLLPFFLSRNEKQFAHESHKRNEKTRLYALDTTRSLPFAFP